MARSILKKWLNKVIFVSVVFFLTTRPAMASVTTTDLPFDDALDKLKGAITGNFLLDVATILFVVMCVIAGFGEFGESMKRIVNVAFWFSLAFEAGTFIYTLFGSGAVF